jgi:hypothetical protein
LADYSIWVLGESQLSITGGVSFDGITQGDGSQLDGEFITINSSSATEVFISDGGADTNFADNDGNQRLDGAQTIDGVNYANNTRIEAEYQIVLRDDSTGIEYTVLAVNIVNSSPAYSTNEAVAFVGMAPPTGVSRRVVSTGEGPPNVGPNAVDTADIVPICLCRGTLVMASTGLKKIEDLCLGDKIRRPDGSLVKLRQIFHTRICGLGLNTNTKLRPIRIMAGALGNGLPARDLLVSRQHRMLLKSKIAERMFGEVEVLVTAIKLTKLPGIFVDDAAQEVEYFHLLFDRHEIIFAEGALTESLYTGPEALKAVSPEAREEILTMFPEVTYLDYVPKPARFIPSGTLQKKLIERHLKNGRPILT